MEGLGCKDSEGNPIPSTWGTSGAGGIGGGATGASATSVSDTPTAASGTDGLGGGGGGAAGPWTVSAETSVASTGGDGGDGVVIVRYQSAADAPTSVTGTASDSGQVTLSWTAPTYLGAGSISGYSVTQASGGSYSAVAAGTCQSSAPTSTATSCTVTGLTAGTEYTFKVATRTTSGSTTYTSDDSTASSGVTVYGTLSQFAVTTTGGAAVGTQTAGTSFNIKVTAQDSGSRTVTSFTGTVDITSTSLFSAGSGTTASFTAGVLASHAVTLKRAGAAQTVTATRTTGGSEAGTSAAFTVNAGAVNKLQILLPGETAAPGTTSGKTGTPTAATAGTPVTATVNAVDANWNLVAASTPTVAITSSDSAATLPSNAALVAGTQDFSVTLKTAGSATVTATDQAGTPLTAAASASVTVNAAAASKLVVSSIGSQTAGVGFSATVTLTDAYGNAVDNTGATGTVTLTRTSGTGTLGGTTSGTIAVGASGVTIAGVTYSKAESGVVLTATGSGASSLVNGKVGASTAFAVTAGTASQYSVALSSTTPTAGGAVTVTAQLQDANGNDVATSGKTVTWSTTATGGSFASPTSTTNASGVATVVYTVSQTSGASGTITATDNTSLTGESSSFTTQVGAANAARSTLSVSSSSATVGGSAVTLTVQAKDQYGNSLTTGGSTVVISRSTGTGTVSAVTDNSNGTYTATVTIPTATGSGTFSATLGGSAVEGGTGSTQTVTVTYTPGTATALVITGSSSQTAGTTQDLTITAQDAYGNTATAYTGDKTLTFSGASQSAAGQVPTVEDKDGTTIAFGTGTAITFASGVASASSGANGVMALYAAEAAAISVTDGSISSATAGDLAVTVSPAALSDFEVTNTSGGTIATQTAGTSFAIKVRAVDAYDNTQTSFTGAVDLTSTSTITSGGGTTSSLSSGVLSSHAITLTTAGASKTITATRTSGGSESGTSAGFTINPATASTSTSLVSASPTSITADGSATSTVTVTLKDAYGNALTGSGGTVVVATDLGSVGVTTNNNNGTYTATLTTGTTAGDATVSATVDTGSGASTITDTATVSLVPDSATKMLMVTQPVAGASQASLSTQPVVRITDANSNTVTSDSATQVTVAASGGTLGGTTTVTAVNGVATFTDLTFAGVVGTNYTLTFTSTPSLTAVTSANMTPSGPGAAATIAVNVGNGQSATAGSAVSTAPSVVVTDAQGNAVQGVAVTFAVASGGGSLASSGVVSTNSSGIATSPAWTLGTTKGSNTLTATSGSLSGSPVTFTATGTAGTPTSIAVTTSAVGAASGAAFTTQPVITFYDTNSNVVDSDSSSVVTATVSSGGTIVGTATATASSGVATFSSLGLTAATGTYTLTYTSGALTATQSITVTVGAATDVSLTTSASGATYGNVWTQQPAIAIVDSGGNTVTSDSSTQVTVSVSTGGSLSGTATITVSSGVATFSGLSMTGTPASYTLTFAASGLTAVTQSLTLAKADQNALTLTSTSGTYGTGITLATSGGTTAGVVSYVVTNGTATGCAESGGTLTSSKAGTCTVTATMAGSTYYNDVSTSATTVTFGAKTLTMTGVTAANKVYNGNTAATLDFTSAALVGVVAGDSTSEIDFDDTSATGTFASAAVANGVAVTVAGVTLTGTKASSYTLSQPTGVTANIEPATRTLSFSTTSYAKTYGAADFTVTATPSAGAGTITYSSTGSGCSVNSATGLVTVLAVGSCSVSASIATDGTYDPASTTTPVTVTVSAKGLTITGMTASNKIFDDSDSATLSFSGASLVGVVGLETVTINSSGASGSFSTADVGTGLTVTASGVVLGGADAANYTLSAQPTTTANITARALTVTATSQSITYGASTPSPAFTESGLQGDDAISSVTFAYTGGNAPNAPTAGGSYTITPSAAVFSSGSSSNYSITYTPGTYTINQDAQTITFGSLAGKTYGDSAFSVSAMASSGLTVSFTSQTTSVCTVSGSTVTIVAAGTCTIRASQAGNGNYSAASDVDQGFTVAKAPLTVTASSPTVTYGGTSPSISPSYSGFVNSESADDLSTAPTCSTAYSTSSNAGSTPATSCSGGVSGDYDFTYVDGTVTINKAPLTITASSPSVTYGDSVPSITASYSGFVNSQTASVLSTAPSCTTAYTTASAAGTTPSTSCSGAAADNYSISYVNGAVTIAKATPTLGSWSNVTKTYGDASYTISAPTVTGVTGNSLAGSFSYSSSDTSVISISSSTATVAGAGSATITATFTPTDTTNYVSGETVTSTVTVGKGLQSTLTVSSTSGTYGSALALTTTGGSTGGSVSYVATPGTASGCTITGSSLAVTSAGTCSVTATMAGDDDYEPVDSAVTTVTFGKSSQTITFTNPASSGATYGDSAIPVAPSSSSGLSVTLTPTDSSVCTVSGGGVNLVSAGTCEITASQAGNGNYLAASDVVRSFTIAKSNQATLTMTSPSSAIYGETITLAASGGSGTGAVSFGVVTGTCTISGSTLTLGDAGSTCSVSATKQTDANYNIQTSAAQPITISKAGQTLAFTSSVPTSPVSGNTYTPAAAATSTVTGSSSGVTPTFAVSGTCSISSGVVTFTASGSCVITASAAGNTNFTAAADVTQTIVVGSINQNITFAQPSNVSFGGSSFALSATTSSSLTVSYSLGAGTTSSACAVSSGGVVSILAVGTCEVVASQAGDAQYAAASSVSRAFQVLPALATAPTLTSASASSQAITVGFTAPGFTGGVSVSAYQVVATPTGAGATVIDTSCSASACTISGLVNGTEYTVTVAAINSAGTGPASGASSALTPATAAYAVGALAATPGDTTVALTWTALTTPQLGGGTFTRYEVYYRVNGDATWTLATNALTTQSTSSYTVSGLSNGTQYDFRVVAITSANGSQIAGNTSDVLQYPSTAPSAPQSLATLAATATDVQFSWAAPNSDGGAVLVSPYYSVTVTSTSSGATTPVTCTFASTSDRFCTVTGLTNGATYTFTVAAINRMGTGTAATTTYNVPSSDATLSDLVVTGTGGAVSLTPSFASGTTSYTASVTNAVSAVTVTPTTTSAGASVTVDGVSVTSASASSSIALAVGSNEIEVVVTASDPRFTETYAITITRAAPTGGGGSGGSGRGGTTPLEPVTPPAAVMDGQELAVVTEGDSVVPVVLQPTSADDGWEALGSDFDVVVRTEEPDGAPVRLAGDRRLAVPQGGRVQVAGDGYQSSSVVRVFMVPRTTTRSGLMPRAVTGAMLLGETAVNAAGDFAATFTVPLSVTVGDYVLQINGVSTRGAVRSFNMGMLVKPGAAPLQVGKVQRAGFFEGLSDEFSAPGKRKLREIVRGVPQDAQAVQVLVAGVSVGLDDLRANAVLAAERAALLAEELQDRGIEGEFTVTVTTSFTADGAERATVGKADVLTTNAGKPLSTVTVLFQEPVAP